MHLLSAWGKVETMTREELITIVLKHKNTAAICEVLGISPRGLRFRLKKHGLTIPGVLFNREKIEYEKPTVETVSGAEEELDGLRERFEEGKDSPVINFPDKKRPAPLDVFKELSRLKSQVDEIKSRSVYQDCGTATAEVKSDKPIILLPTSDWHISDYLDVDNFLDFIRLVLANKFIYLFLGGDYSDNFISVKFIGELIRAIFPPHLQQELMYGVLDLLEERILGALPGNHDLFVKKALGFMDEHRLRKYRFPVYKNQVGRLNVKIGSQEYRVMFAHKYRFNSSFNLTHCVKQMWKNHSAFDVGIVGHHHEAASEATKIQGKDVYCLRTGSFKKDDDFSTDEGYLTTFNDMPCVVLYPNEHRIIEFSKLRNALEFMRMYWEEEKP